MTFRYASASVALLTLVATSSAAPTGNAPGKKDPPPNILFVVMDDFVVDQNDLHGWAV